MSLMIRTTSALLLVFTILAGCGYNPKDSGKGIPAVVEKGTLECLYPDAGCHAAAGTWTVTWATAVHANSDDLPSFGYTDENCAGCHNPVEEERNDSSYLFTAGGNPGPPDRPIVGCEACHGAGMEHFAYAHADTADGTPPTIHPSYDPAFGDTHYLPDSATVWNTFPNADHIVSCGPCHSPDQHAGGASLLMDVGLVLVPEVAQGGEHRVGRGLAQPAEAGGLDHPGEMLQLLQIVAFALAGAEPLQDVQHAAGADAAGGALAAGLVLRELQEIAGDIDHAVVFVQHDQTAAAHDRANPGQRVIVDRRVCQFSRHTTA